MNHCAIQQNNAFSACEEMRNLRDAVVCPKPRRLRNVTIHEPVRSCRWHLGHQAELCDGRAGSDLLENLLTRVWSLDPFYNVGFQICNQNYCRRGKEVMFAPILGTNQQ